MIADTVLPLGIVLQLGQSRYQYIRFRNHIFACKPFFCLDRTLASDSALSRQLWNGMQNWSWSSPGLMDGYGLGDSSPSAAVLS